jgi:hypothetical protein
LMSLSSPSAPPPHALPPLTLTPSLFPTDMVVQPLLPLYPTGTAPPCPSPSPCHSSPPTSDAPGPAPCMGPEASSDAAPAPTPDAGPGMSASAPLRISPSRCTSTSVVHGRLRCLSHPRWSLLRQRRLHHPWPLLRRRRLPRRRGRGWPCCAAGVPPTAPSPTPVLRSPYGDATHGWYPAALRSHGVAR